MASPKDTATFFTEGSSNQFEYVLSLYPEALRLKAEKKVKKPEELIKLDNWYQNELPKKIKSRGKDAHLNHEELVQTMKWKQTRGKFYPQLSYLVKVNTPRAVMMETRKAFRKLPNLEQAIMALSNLKGVGTTMASALLAAAAPDKAPFMADECLKAIPDIDGIDYTTKEYLNFVQHISQTVSRLNGESAANISFWNPHNVELALWTHYVASELRPELLDSIPGPVRNGKVAHQNGDVDSSLLKNPAPVMDPSSEDSNLDAANNGKSAAALVDENSTTSFTEDSLDKPLTPGPSTPAPSTPASVSALAADLAAEPDSTSNGAGEETNDSIATSDSATNDSTIANAVTATNSRESGEGEVSRSSVGEVKEAEKRKQEPVEVEEETQVAKKAKTEEEVEPDTQQKEDGEEK